MQFGTHLYITSRLHLFYLSKYTLNTFINLFILKKGGLNTGEHGGTCDIRSHKRGCCCINIWTSGRISTGGTCFFTANHLLIDHFLLLVIVTGKKIIEEMMPPVNDVEECKMSQLNTISESGFCYSLANEQSFERINKINDGDR